jgi:hypothetical protein
MPPKKKVVKDSVDSVSLHPERGEVDELCDLKVTVDSHAIEDEHVMHVATDTGLSLADSYFLAEVQGDTQGFAKNVAEACKTRKRPTLESRVEELFGDSEVLTKRRKFTNPRATETCGSAVLDVSGENIFSLPVGPRVVPVGKPQINARVPFRGAPAGATRATARPVLPADLSGLKTTLGIESMSRQISELIGVVSNMSNFTGAPAGMPGVSDEQCYFDEADGDEWDENEAPEIVDVSEFGFGQVPFSAAEGTPAEIPLSDQLFEDEKTGEPVSETLSAFLNKICTHKSNVSELMKKHPRPENCEFVGSPRLNQEVWNAVPLVARTRDSLMQEIQKSLAAGMVPLLRIAEMPGVSDEPCNFGEMDV